MDVRQETRVGHLILTPGDSLMCGGRAEQFEQLLQEVIAAGQCHLIVDLGAVAHADSGGVRALLRGHLTVQQRGGRLALANIPGNVQRVLHLLKLDTVFPIYDSVDGALSDLAGT
jgi:anti-sigma B factor antagonist